MSEENEEGVETVKEAYVPGTLYIMQETDYLTGEKFDYYKIGIVRGEKDVAAREKEHSTGNPRRIASVKDILSPAVQKLETRLHNEYARQRVSSGEWFHLPGDLVQEVIALAEALNAELEAEIDVLKASKLIEGPGSNPALTLSGDILSISERLSEVLGQSAVVTSYKKTVDSKLKELAQGKDEWKHLFEVRYYKERNAFSATELKKKYKALYEEYQRILKVTVNPKFVVEPKSYDESSLLSELGLVEPEKLGEDIIGLHQANLAHWSVDAQLKWEQEILEAQLLTAATDAQGIEGVLLWNIRESKNFDKEAFIVDHPEEYSDSFKLRAASTTWRVAEWASYAR
jgi:hypothetical protein